MSPDEKLDLMLKTLRDFTEDVMLYEALSLTEYTTWKKLRERLDELEVIFEAPDLGLVVSRDPLKDDEERKERMRKRRPARRQRER